MDGLHVSRVIHTWKNDIINLFTPARCENI